MKRPDRAGSPFIVTLLLFSLIPLQGCGIFDEGTPDTARLVITGPAEDFQLVTTTDFEVLAGTDEEEGNRVYLNSADTSTVSAPHNQSFSLGSRKRFYVKAFSVEALSQPINVRVLIDGEERYSSSSTLEDLALEFIYTIR